jgi:hypothetical protein
MKFLGSLVTSFGGQRRGSGGGDSEKFQGGRACSCFATQVIFSCAWKPNLDTHGFVAPAGACDRRVGTQ